MCEGKLQRRATPKSNTSQITPGQPHSCLCWQLMLMLTGCLPILKICFLRFSELFKSCFTKSQVDEQVWLYRCAAACPTHPPTKLCKPQQQKKTFQTSYSPVAVNKTPSISLFAARLLSSAVMEESCKFLNLISFFYIKNLSSHLNLLQ